MNLTNEPTVPGLYWWREKEGDDWEERLLEHVYGELCYLNTESGWEPCWVPVDELDQGQFFGPLPTPDKVVEMSGVVCPRGKVVFASPSVEKIQSECEYLNENDHTLMDGEAYTCRRVLFLEGGGE